MKRISPEIIQQFKQTSEYRTHMKSMPKFRSKTDISAEEYFYNFHLPKWCTMTFESFFSPGSIHESPPPPASQSSREIKSHIQKRALGRNVARNPFSSRNRRVRGSVLNHDDIVIRPGGVERNEKGVSEIVTVAQGEENTNRNNNAGGEEKRTKRKISKKKRMSNTRKFIKRAMKDKKGTKDEIPVLLFPPTPKQKTKKEIIQMSKKKKIDVPTKDEIEKRMEDFKAHLENKKQVKKKLLAIIDGWLLRHRLKNKKGKGMVKKLLRLRSVQENLEYDGKNEKEVINAREQYEFFFENMMYYLMYRQGSSTAISKAVEQKTQVIEKKKKIISPDVSKRLRQSIFEKRRSNSIHKVSHKRGYSVPVHLKPKKKIKKAKIKLKKTKKFSLIKKLMKENEKELEENFEKWFQIKRFSKIPQITLEELTEHFPWK